MTKDDKKWHDEFYNLMKLEKIDLVEIIIDFEIRNQRSFKQQAELISTMCKEHKESIEARNDHIGSLQEKIELLHLDLAQQIHWRLKLEEELKSGIQRN